MPGQQSILVVDDHALLADALVTALQSRGLEDVHAVAVAPMSDRAVITAARDLRPDVVLLDVHLAPNHTALGLVRPLRAVGAQVVVMTASRDSVLLAAFIEAGAVGVLDKAEPFGEMVAMIRSVLNGERIMSVTEREELLAGLREHRQRDQSLRAPFATLTPREAAVLGELLEGRTAEDIAERNGVAVSTIRSQIKAVHSKLGVRNQLAAVALARQVGWTPEAP